MIISKCWFGKIEVIFPESSRNIPRMFVSKSFNDIPGILQNFENTFVSEKAQKIVFLGYPAKILILAVSSLAIFRVMYWKGLRRSFTAGKNFKMAQHFYNHYKSFPSGTWCIRDFSAVANICNCTCFWRHGFDNMLQKWFNCNYRRSTSLPRRIIEASTHWAFTCSKSLIETLENSVKYVQS